MSRKIMLLVAAFLVIGLGYQPVSAADLSVHPYGRNGVGTFHTLGFWGEPFPYGYRWSVARACTRYEPVDTAHGVRMKKVWVCGYRR